MNNHKKFSCNKKRQGFTLVELIIVITILAILSVSAFLVVSQWIGKSRDSRRLSDLGTIQRALEVSLTKNSSYPAPDSAVNITAGSIIIGQQGKFGDSATAATDIKTTPKDPLDNVAYTYYVATGGEDYQIMGFLENSSTLTFRGIEAQGPRSTVSDQENLQFSNSACTCNSNGTNSICSVASLAFCLNYAHASEVSAADYSVRIPTVKGETLGILILSGTNQPVEELGSTVDLNTTTSNLIAVFSNTDKSSGTGGQIISPITIKSHAFLTNTSLTNIDSSLVVYYDMQTLNGSKLKDLSKYGNDGTCNNNGVPVNCGLQNDYPKFNNNGYASFITGYTITASSISALSGALNKATFLIKLRTNTEIISRPVFLGGSSGNFYLYGGTTVLQVSVNGSGNYFVPQGFKINEPGVIVGSYDGSEAKQYVNGKYINSSAVTIPFLFHGGSLVIGAANANGAFFNGDIYEFRVYNRVLSDSEIQSLSLVSK